MPSLDRGFKIVSRVSGRHLADRLAHIVCTSWRPIVSEIQAVERLADRAFRAAKGRERFVVYMEAYTYWEEDVRWSLLAKSGLLSERERLPTIAIVFFLHPKGYHSLEGSFRLEALNGPTQQLWVREVCLWKEVPDASWESVPGLMALYPLCRHGKPSRQALTHAAQAITRAVPESTSRADLLTVLGLFGKLAYPELDTFGLIGREHMRESPGYQEIMDEGRVEESRKHILINVEERFGTAAVEPMRADVQTIEDLTRLERVFRASVRCADLDAFRAVLRQEIPKQRKKRASSAKS